VGPSLAGLRDADPRPGDDRRFRLSRRPRLHAQRGGRVAEIDPGHRAVDVERGANEARATGESLRWEPREPIAIAGNGSVSGELAASQATQPRLAHLLNPFQRLDRADENCGRRPGRFGDDIEAVVHPVDKVHVGDAGWPEHDGVAGGSAEAGVGGEIGLADVGLDLHDSAGSAAAGGIVDQAGAEESPGGVEGGAGEDGPVEGRQRSRLSGWGRRPARRPA